MLYEMKKLLKVTGRGMQFLILLCLRCPFDAAMTMINACFLQHAFDAVAQNDGKGLAMVCLSFGIATLCLFLYNGIIWSIYAPFITRMESRLRIKLFERISTFPYEKIEGTSQGEWLTRLNIDVQMPFSRPLHLPHAACAMINISVSAGILWHMNKTVFGCVLLFVIPHVLISQLCIARAMPGLNKKSLEATANNTDELTALITCADITALYNGQDFLLRRFERSSLHLLRANMRIRSRNALSAAILPIFGMGGYLMLLIMSGSWIAKGRFTFGDLTAAFQYRGGVLTGVLMLISCLISIQASMAGIQRLNQVLSEKTEGLNG